MCGIIYFAMENDSVKYFGLKAVVEGDFILKGPIKSYKNSFEISLFLEEDVYKIGIIKKITKDSPLNLNYKTCSGIANVIVPDESYYKEYIRQLQSIESIGGYHYNISKILYKETLELMWLSGDEMFKNLEIVCSVRKKYKAPQKKVLSQSNLSSILLLNRIIPDASIPYNYYREANNYLQNQEYRHAYPHLYMIIEYCFANGKLEKKSQISEFMQSLDLCFAVLDSLATVKTEIPRYYNWLQTEIHNKYAFFTLKNVFKYLYQQRGILAHGSLRSAMYVSNEDDLQIITIFINQICFIVCGNMQVYCMSSEDFKKKRLSERCEMLKSELKISME